MRDDRFEWDDAKAAQNLAKHGISFEEARLVFRDLHAVEVDEDQLGYGERRFNMIGRSGSCLLIVTFTERENRVRIISARRAERAERDYWVRENPPFNERC
jgi:uncharacterized DUF497 family protein